MKKRIILLLFVLMVCLTVTHVLALEITTEGGLNGRAWEGMTMQEKVYFLYGIEDGVTLMESALMVARPGEIARVAEVAASTFKIKGFSYGEIAQQIDVIY